MINLQKSNRGLRSLHLLHINITIIILCRKSWSGISPQTQVRVSQACIVTLYALKLRVKVNF